jgi:hypothetical protein
VTLVIGTGTVAAGDAKERSPKVDGVKGFVVSTKDGDHRAGALVAARYPAVEGARERIRASFTVFRSGERIATARDRGSIPAGARRGYLRYVHVLTFSRAETRAVLGTADRAARSLSEPNLASTTRLVEYVGGDPPLVANEQGPTRFLQEEKPVRVENGCVIKPQTDCPFAQLFGSELAGASLARANLHEARAPVVDLSAADLSGSNLRGAVLEGADLAGANLRDANLRDANLGYANLTGADLTGASLTNATCPNGAPASPSCGPESRTVEPRTGVWATNRYFNFDVTACQSSRIGFCVARPRFTLPNGSTHTVRNAFPIEGSAEPYAGARVSFETGIRLAPSRIEIEFKTPNYGLAVAHFADGRPPERLRIVFAGR